MNKNKMNELFKDLSAVNDNFEVEAITLNIKPIKENYDINSANNPKKYWRILEELQELSRQTRILFIHSALNKICIEEGKLYQFDDAFQASMEYTAVMKKENNFYLLDEDGDYREVFISENFARFIDEQYWELYD